MRLNLHEWGDPAAPPIICLHGITAHGRRFRKLAEERLLPKHRVLAPDLRGHGRSDWEPPWGISTHLDDIVETVGVDRAVWLGHSFGGRLVVELAARDPGRVEAAILLDPALQILPHVAFNLSEEERKDVSFASHDEAIEARIESGRVLHTPRELLVEEMEEHLEQGRDGNLRLRYSHPAVIAAYSEMALPPPPFDRIRVPTLLVLGGQSWLLLDDHLDAYREALGDLLEIVTVPGGHTVFWDAFDETAEAIERFLEAQGRQARS